MDDITIESGTIEAYGVPLYYEVAGSGPALVLLHEGLADSRMYDYQFADFARQYRVIRYDLLGFGRSGSPAQEYTQHESLHLLLQHLKVDKAALFGMSLGGMVAQDFVLTYPAMVSALLFMASGVHALPEDEDFGAESGKVRLAPFGAAMQQGEFVRAIEIAVHVWFDGSKRTPEQVDSVPREHFRELYTDVLRRSREQARAADFLEPPAYTRLHEIHVPTLVVIGSGDLPEVQKSANVLARSIAGARKVTIPDVGHLFNMERPAEVNHLVLDFLRENVR